MAVLISLALGCTSPLPPVWEKLEQVRVPVGEVFTIPLTANPSTGYDWTVKHDPAMVEFLDYESNSARTPPAPGDQVYRTYKFKALKRGETKITLVYERSRERGFAISEILERIEVPVTIW